MCIPHDLTTKLNIQAAKDFDKLWEESKPKKWLVRSTYLPVRAVDNLSQMPHLPSCDGLWEPFASEFVMFGGVYYRVISWRQLVTDTKDVKDGSSLDT